jgi:hypothetical protein
MPQFSDTIALPEIEIDAVRAQGGAGENHAQFNVIPLKHAVRQPVTMKVDAPQMMQLRCEEFHGWR